MTVMTMLRALAFSSLSVAACGGGGAIPQAGSGDPGVATAQSRVCPGSTQIQGVDVSDYDGDIDWVQVQASGIQFALIRVSDGTTYMDQQFTANWTGAKAAGLAVGAYQYFRPDEDPTAQANVVLSAMSQVGYGPGDIQPIVDFEITDGLSDSTVLANINTWLQTTEAQTGRRPIMYTSARVWAEINDPEPSPLPYLWDANWEVSCPNLPPNWGRLRFWQYSATGKVPGISDDADLDLYNGPLSEMLGL